MGDLILCSQPLAAFPYYLENAAVNIYSLEELCYYIDKNLYLLDEDFVDEGLCSFVERELKLPKLAGELGEICHRNGTAAEFAECILRETGYFNTEKTDRIIARLREIEHKSEFECGKLRADRYAAGGRIVRAIYEYYRVLGDESGQNQILIGDVWHNLGCAYAGLFLFDEAADCYERAYERNRNPESLRECLYARALTADKTALKAEEAPGVDAEQLLDIRRALKEAEGAGNPDRQAQLSDGEKAGKLVAEWKDTYRENCRV